MRALSAAFDGEASDAQLLCAEQHRAQCAACQVLWSEWEQTRDLLLAVPTPLPPVLLQEQILLTCRALQDADGVGLRDEMTPNALPSRADLLAYLEAADEEFSVARLAPFIPEVATPSSLLRQILQRTTRAPKSTHAGLWLAVRALFQAGSTPDTRASRAARWGVGLAVPALAAWMILATQTSLVQTPTIQNPSVLPVTPNPEPAEESAAPEPTQQAPVFPSVEKTAPRIAVVPNSAKLQSLGKPSIKAQGNENSDSVSPRDASVSFETVKFESVKRAPKVALKKPGIKKPRVKAASKSQIRAVPLVDKAINSHPKISRVALKPSASRVRLVTAHPNASHRISSPVSATSALRFADIRFAGEDFDETLTAIARARDNRPEDLGRALDEYSASLLAENISENDDDDWG